MSLSINHATSSSHHLPHSKPFAIFPMLIVRKQHMVHIEFYQTLLLCLCHRHDLQMSEQVNKTNWVAWAGKPPNRRQVAYNLMPCYVQAASQACKHFRYKSASYFFYCWKGWITKSNTTIASPHWNIHVKVILIICALSDIQISKSALWLQN